MTPEFRTRFALVSPRGCAERPDFSYPKAMAIRFTLNGEPCEVEAEHPHQTLLAWLRERGLTGTKEGCGEGECGACAVALVVRDELADALRSAADGESTRVQRARYVTVNSCLVPLAALDGQKLVTVEGVADADGSLHPVQSALVEASGSQCGYCTPGFVMSLFSEYYRPERSAYDPEAISGNLCRCTGYRPIVDAARSLGTPRRGDRHLNVLANAQPPLAASDFSAHDARFLRPTTLDELFAHWAHEPTATLIAGGTDLMVYRNQRHTRFRTLLSLEAVAELKRIEIGERETVIGAAVSLSALEALAAREPELLPLLQRLFPLFSSRLIRNRATLGGNLGTASPIGDASPVLLALDAELTLAKGALRRRMKLRDFFVAYRKTALLPGELIESVHVPRAQPRLQRFYKVSKRVLDDISAVAAAFALELDAGGQIEVLRMAFGGIAATPLRASELEDAVRGRPWTRATLDFLTQELAGIGTPLSDQRASAAYRRAMPAALLRKFFDETTRREEAAE